MGNFAEEAPIQGSGLDGLDQRLLLNVRGCSSNVNKQRVRKDRQVPGAPEIRSGVFRRGSGPEMTRAGGLAGRETAGG